MGTFITQSAIAWLAFLPVLARAGFVQYDMVLEPDSSSIHYNDGFIRAPGFIDLGSLSFVTLSEARVSSTDDDTGMDDDGDQFDKTKLDIVVLALPQDCVYTRKGCDWAKLGVGNRSSDGILQYCCTKMAAKEGVCSNSANTLGRLILDNTTFQGGHGFITVPREGDMKTAMPNGHFQLTESATYVVLFANCNEAGREIFITGQSVWKSKHGYLPGELFGFMVFYTFITVIYFAMLVWYGLCMYAYKEFRVEIENWICLAFVLGLIEMIFRTGDYFVWNKAGSRSNIVIWIGVVTGVLKQGISRCLIVMVLLGWGVVRDSLGSTMQAIVVLGASYIGVSAVRDLSLVFAIEDMNTLSEGQEDGIFNVVRILTLVVSLIDVVFLVWIIILWILDARSHTVMYLGNTNQIQKRERFLKLSCLLMVTILFTVVTTVISSVDLGNNDGIVAEEKAWAIDAAAEVNYLFVLIGIGILWKPNPNPREYACVLDVPAPGGENELELTGVVPSAVDLDNGTDDDGTHTIS